MFTDFVNKLMPESKNGRLAVRILGVLAVIYIILEIPSIATGPDGVLPLFTVVLCAVYALFALGLNIVVGFAGLLDLGYVAFFLFGAYTAAWLMSDFGYQVSSRPGSSRHQFSFDVHFLTAALDTIKGHNRRIFDKLDVKRRTEAIARARDLGLL